jgi:hypothetical protein
MANPNEPPGQVPAPAPAPVAPVPLGKTNQAKMRTVQLFVNGDKALDLTVDQEVIRFDLQLALQEVDPSRPIIT